MVFQFCISCFPSLRYIEAMVHCASTRHPAAIVDGLHVQVLREAVQNSKTTFSENVRAFYSVESCTLSTLHVYIISKLEELECINILLAIEIGIHGHF